MFHPWYIGTLPALTESTYGCIDKAATKEIAQAEFDAELSYSFGGGPSSGFSTKSYE